MSEKILSIFIDESGDFGPYKPHTPYYLVSMIKKSTFPNVMSMTSKISKALATILRNNESFWNNFDKVIIYYDNGQIELTKILTSVFSTLYTHVEFRKVKPVDYKLFQVADLICTMELLAEKAENSSFTHSELDFFNNIRDFKKNYLKHVRKKIL